MDKNQLPETTRIVLEGCLEDALEKSKAASGSLWLADATSNQFHGLIALKRTGGGLAAVSSQLSLGAGELAALQRGRPVWRTPRVGPSRPKYGDIYRTEQDYDERPAANRTVFAVVPAGDETFILPCFDGPRLRAVVSLTGPEMESSVVDSLKGLCSRIAGVLPAAS